MDNAFFALWREDAVMGNPFCEIIKMLHRLTAGNDAAAFFKLDFFCFLKMVGKKKEAVVLPKKILHFLV